MADLVKRTKPGLGLVKKGTKALNKLKSAAMRSAECQEVLFLVIDHSGSMTGRSGNSHLTKMEAVKSAIDGGLLENCSSAVSKIGVMEFDDKFNTVCILTNRYSMVRQAVASIEACGGTTILPVLEATNALLFLQETQIRRMIVLSDGEAWDSVDAVAWAKGIVAKNRHRLAVIDTIYFNDSDYGKDLMVKLAEISGGKFYYASDFEQLKKTFKQLDVKTRGLLTA